MKKIMLLGMFLVLFNMVSAESFRIDIVGKNIGMVIDQLGEKVNASTATWMKEKHDQRLLFCGPVDEQWEKRTFSFIAKQDGRVEVILMGDINKPGAPLIAYDDITVNGKWMDNGSFETVSNGQPRPWWGKGELRKDGGAEGQNYVLANHMQTFWQGFTVKKGEVVTISFQCRKNLSGEKKQN